MKVVMLLTKQVPCDEIFTKTENYKQVLDKIHAFF